ncbi:MAG: type III pantothenate kinase [Bacteroidetes bacterium]|nr:MAG: type III pantothenate kinase [Bacteroidota bacterium]TAG89013.1 MAG: type III pantothenate kinase [Bacteroidota bacterium]
MNTKKYATVDIGNSRIKTGIFIEDKLTEENYFSELAEVDIWVKKTKPNFTIFSSVKNISSPYLKEMESITNVYVLNHDLPIPFKNLYQTPKTLGSDRLASVAGAMYLYPHKNCLVFDLGTCITSDFINKNAEFLGGNISLGMLMRFRALHEYTAKLPWLQATDKITLTGNHTEQAIENGVIQGIVWEMKGCIEAYRQKYSEVEIIFCGGDADFFIEFFKEINVNSLPNINLWGLYFILKSNLEEK